MASSDCATNNLSLILPPRAGQTFREYLQVVEGIFQEVVEEDFVTLLSEMLSHKVIVFQMPKRIPGSCVVFIA